METYIIISRRDSLCFTASDISGIRTNESFQTIPAEKETTQTIIQISKKCFSYLPEKFHPKDL